jgi:hypothetical protein
MTDTTPATPESTPSALPAVGASSPKVDTSAEHVAPTGAPEIWYKGKRVIRTLLVSLPTLLVILNVSLPLFAQAFKVDGVPAAVYGVANGVVVVILVIVAVLTRIIAIPVVNSFLTKLGAGSVPASALK